MSIHAADFRNTSSTYEIDMKFMSLSLVLLATVGAVNSGEYFGLDQDADLVCGVSEMTIPNALTGTRHTVRFFVETSAPLSEVMCTFCVEDKNMIANPVISFDHPDGWFWHHFYDSEILSSGFPSPWIIEAYPDFWCWQVHGYDLSLSTPWITPAHTVTMSFDVAQDGCIGFVLDGTNSLWVTESAYGFFEASGETCDPGNCAIATSVSVPERELFQWGEIKQLFR